MSDIRTVFARIERNCQRLEALGAVQGVDISALADLIRVDVRIIRDMTPAEFTTAANWVGNLAREERRRPDRLDLDFAASSHPAARHIALEQAKAYASEHPEVSSFGVPHLEGERYEREGWGFVQRWTFSVALCYSESD